MSTEVILSYENTCLTIGDSKLLDNGKWLNDKIIGFVFEYFEVEKFLHLKDSICLLSPEVTQFIKFADAKEARIMLEPLNIQFKELIFLPVNNNMSCNEPGGSHWSLLIYEKSSLKQYHLDSLCQANETIARTLAVKVNQLFQSTVMRHGHQFLCALRPPDDHVDSNSHISYFAHLLTSIQCLLNIAELPLCTFGLLLQDECHKTVYTRSVGLHNLSELSDANFELLMLRTKPVDQLQRENCNICFHHEQVLLEKFDKLQRSCCDSFNKHQCKVTKSLSAVSIDKAKELTNTNNWETHQTW